MTDVKYLEDFERLLHAVMPTITKEDAHTIALAAHDWISPGANDSVLNEYYSKCNPPYRAPHRLMISISELRLVKGVTAEIFDALSPYITALPQLTQININNAAPPVLMSLSPTLTLAAAKTVENFRRQTPFINIDMFTNFDVIKNNLISRDKIEILSSYFLVETNVTVGEQQVMLLTLLQRVIQGRQAK